MDPSWPFNDVRSKKYSTIIVEYAYTPDYEVLNCKVEEGHVQIRCILRDII